MAAMFRRFLAFAYLAAGAAVIFQEAYAAFGVCPYTFADDVELLLLVGLIGAPALAAGTWLSRNRPRALGIAIHAGALAAVVILAGTVPPIGHTPVSYFRFRYGFANFALLMLVGQWLRIKGVSASRLRPASVQA
jgi:hypothetical protein